MVDRWIRVVYVSLPLFFLLFGYTVEQQLLVSGQELLALFHLRSSLGLRSRDWPIKDNPCTSWKGIQCTNGRVTGISISGFRRTSRGRRNPQFSVDALQNLTLLSSFKASNFALPGSIPEWLGLRLSSLRVLDLRSCSIIGAIPLTIGNLSRLDELYLSGNNINGTVPLSLARLSNLQVLDLSRNSLSGSIPGSFAALGKLVILDISLNSLSGVIPPGIGALSQLRYLNLSGNNLSSSIPPQVGHLSSLVDLDLGFNSLSGSLPPDWKDLTSLQRMVVEHNFLSGQLPANLFAPLTQLQVLVLSQNGFVGEFPNVLWSIPSLQTLDLAVNNFTGSLPNISLVVNASGGAVANISHNLFYGNITNVISKFSLTDMTGNYFEGPVPSYAPGRTLLGQNCLRNSTDQRSLQECVSFYAERNLVFDDFGEPISPPLTLPPETKHNNRRKLIIVLASVFGGLLFIGILMITIILLLLCKPNRGTANQRAISVGPVPTAGGSPPPAGGVPLIFSNLGDAFTYQQILNATGELSDANLIKHGHSGDLFRGLLEGGISVVIKKVDLNSSAKKDSYTSELNLFSKVSHPRLVPLLGHCLEHENEKFIVYKYMPKGDLANSLFKKTRSDGSLQSLDWITRLKIAIGAAEGLCYLHHECNPPLVHRDIQASSILLDDKFEVCLGSLSEVCAQESEPPQVRISRLLRLPTMSDQGASVTSNATCPYDVYCFGKVLLELVTGKLGISSSPDSTMKEWLDTTLPYISIYDKELVQNIVDPSLILDEDFLEEVWAMAIVARSCLNPRPLRRPLMRYILKALENPLKVIREDSSASSARFRTASSRGSWNATLFGSWRQSSSDVMAVQPGQGRSQRVRGAAGSLRRFGTMGSDGSRENSGEGNGNSRSSSIRRHAKEIFPEPLDERDSGGGSNGGEGRNA